MRSERKIDLINSKTDPFIMNGFLLKVFSGGKRGYWVGDSGRVKRKRRRPGVITTVIDEQRADGSIASDFWFLS